MKLNITTTKSQVFITMGAIFAILALALLSCFVFASDPSPLQDFCVAIDEPRSPALFVNGKFCKDPKLVTANDFFPNARKHSEQSGIKFHYSYRRPNTRTQYPGDILSSDRLHLMQNVERTSAIAISSIPSQNPDKMIIANTVFGSNPSINVLAKAFQINKTTVDYIQAQFR
ncbi:hypothetical protein GIB67_028860 [Kingdonia uniflora]|uniref:Cupin type-1 domain-containing protein n=1 Tax=Kingdonia uniflora TaxID=39325 RepID=A0A7J7LT82_9MAGN|nr:hypothetical protein GIB67_028860 [Kingdonia uniflora]